MTNEEALTLLKQHDYWTQYSWQDEVCEIAISALESIDRITAERDAAIASLKEEAKDNQNACYYCIYPITNECDDCDCECSNWEWRGIQL